jgi:hypothetical protein
MSLSIGLRTRQLDNTGRAVRFAQLQSFHSSRTNFLQEERPEATSSSSQASSSSHKETASTSEQKSRANILAQLRNNLKQKRTDLEPVLKQRLEELGKRWNHYSGYEEVLEVKAQTLEAELHLKQLRDEQSKIREEYMTSIKSRSDSQKTLNDLLTRRANWSEADISTYTQLLRSEHAEAKSEKESGEQYESVERRVNAAWDDVVKKTLERYHLEQVWSDQVRTGSTYGGLIVAGLNGKWKRNRCVS